MPRPAAHKEKGPATPRGMTGPRWARLHGATPLGGNDEYAAGTLAASALCEDADNVVSGLALRLAVHEAIKGAVLADARMARAIGRAVRPHGARRHRLPSAAEQHLEPALGVIEV